MNLYKQLSIALLCTSISPFISIGMDGIKDEEMRKTKVSQQTAEVYYKEAIQLINTYLAGKSSEAKLFAEAVGKLEFAAQCGHSSSLTLVELMIPLLPRCSENPEVTPERAASFAQLHFMLENFDQGFQCLLPLLKVNYSGLGAYLDKILSNNATITYFFIRLKALEKSKSLSTKDLTQITQTLLDNFAFNNINCNKATEIAPHIQKVIGFTYLNAFKNPQINLDDFIKMPKLDGEMQRKYTYLSQGIKYAIFSAKQGDQDAYDVLRSTLLGLGAYDIYYDHLLDHMDQEDTQASSLFNRIATADPRALGYCNESYSQTLLTNRRAKDLKNLGWLMSNYKQYLDQTLVDWREKKKEESTPSALLPASQPKDWFAGEPPVQGKFAGNTQEDLLSPDEQAEQDYQAGMEMLNIAPHDALGRLREAEKMGHQGAIKKLNEIRQSPGYKKNPKTPGSKNPKKANRTDLGELLRTLEPTLEEQLYKVTSNLDVNPVDNIGFLIKLSKNDNAPTTLRKRANLELEYIRDRRSYKKPGTVRPANHSRDIGYLLRQLEKPTISLNSSQLDQHATPITETDPKLNIKEEVLSPAAQYQRAVSYFKGIGVEKNEEEGFKCLKRAADGEHIDAKRLMKYKGKPKFYPMLEVTESLNDRFMKMISDPRGVATLDAAINNPNVNNAFDAVKSNPLDFNAIDTIFGALKIDQCTTSTKDAVPAPFVEASKNERVTPPSKDKQPRKKKAKSPILLSSAQQNLVSNQAPNDSSPDTTLSQSVITSLASPKETPTQLTLIKRKRKDKASKTSTPTLEVNIDQLPDQSPEEGASLKEKDKENNESTSVLPGDNAQLPDQSPEAESPLTKSTVSLANKINRTLPQEKRKGIKKTHSLSNLLRATSEISEEGSTSKEELLSNETTSKEGKQPRKSLNRTKSLITVLPSSEISENTSANTEKKKSKSPITKINFKEYKSLKEKEKREKRSSLNLSKTEIEETSDCSSSERSTSDKPVGELYKQDGKRDENLKRLKQLLAKNVSAIKVADIKITRSMLIRALRELGPNGKGIITWNFQTEGNKNENIIRADIIRTSKNLHLNLPTLNIHLHSRKGKWYDDSNIKKHIWDFIRACDEEVDMLIKEIENKKEKK